MTILGDLFPGFRDGRTTVDGTAIAHLVGGSGPPLLLLHGHPQTRAMWHRVAPDLARDFTVVVADLRGYGDSDKPPGDAVHATYSKRAMAADMVALMRALGFDRFDLVAHDRGARVGHRLCRDHRGAVRRFMALDIAPTLAMVEGTTRAFATAYWHWFFLIQGDGIPERMIGADPSFYVRSMLSRSPMGLGGFDPRALAEYERCFALPGAVHATCEDYRAAATVDLDHDRADLDRPVALPVRVLWGERGVVHACFDPLAEWRRVATDVTGRPMPTGHYLAEEDPEGTLAEIRAFLAG
jgi:haloacetate dehalogenase